MRKTFLAFILIAVPTGFASAAASKTSKTSKKVQAVKKMSVLKRALDMFYADCGRYPTTEEGLNALVSPVNCEKWGPKPYLKLVSDDPWGYHWYYQSQNSNSFEVVSLGADGREGGEGDDADLVMESK